MNDEYDQDFDNFQILVDEMSMSPQLPPEIWRRVIDFCDPWSCVALTQVCSQFLQILLFEKHLATFAGVWDISEDFRYTNHGVNMTKHTDIIEFSGTKRQITAFLNKSPDEIPQLGRWIKKRFKITVNLRDRQVSNSIKILSLLSMFHKKYKSKEPTYENLVYFSRYGKYLTMPQKKAQKRVCYKRFFPGCLCFERNGDRHTCYSCLFGCCRKVEESPFYVTCAKHGLHLQIFTTS